MQFTEQYKPSQPVVFTPWTCDRLKRINAVRRILVRMGYQITEENLYCQRLNGAAVLHVATNHTQTMVPLMEKLTDQRWLDYEGYKYGLGYINDVAVTWRTGR